MSTELLTFSWFVTCYSTVFFPAKYFVSCEEAKILNPLLPSLQIMIDIDDSGPFDPFPVNCVFQGKQLSLNCTEELISILLCPCA